MLFYEQNTGKIFIGEKLIGTGYSGAGKTLAEGRNNPDRQGEKSVGPIPVGQYKIGAAFTHKTKGAVCMRLTPIGHKALGRSGFLIHGDNKDGNASEGCIIQSLRTRNAIANCGEKILEVVRG